MPRPRTIHKINMVAGRGQAPINFTSLGIGRHSKSVYNIVNRRVFPHKSYPEPELSVSISDRLIEKLWTQTLGTSAPDTSYGVAIDSNNYVYITGYTYGDLDNLDGITNQGGYDAFLTKYESNGTRIWTKLLGTASPDRSIGVAIDSNNNVYITGYTSGDLDGITNQGGYDAFLTKYDSDGTIIWTQLLGTVVNDFSLGVAIDSNNNVYITGYTLGNLDGNTNQGSYDTFLTKYDSNGTRIWIKTLGTASADYTTAVAIDSNNYVYITGSTDGNLDGNTITEQGYSDAFLTKYDSDGTIIWTETLGSTSYDVSYGVAIDSNNYVYITGYTKGDLDGNTITEQGKYDAFLTKYDSDGTIIWTETLGSNSDDRSYGVAIDSNNYVYITGYTKGNLDGNTITNEGGRDVFLTKYGSDGTKKWTKTLGSTTNVPWAYSVDIDSNNNVYITGSTNGDLDGNTQIGGGDAFLTKYG